LTSVSKFTVLSVVLFAFSNTIKAQATATATADATIVTPISIVKTADMNFGNIAVSTTGGTVIMSPAGIRSNTGGITMPAVSGTVSAAAFTVAGQANYVYDITLPSSEVVLTNGANTMNSAIFTTDITASQGTLSAGGSQQIKVGATLTVSAGQAPGTYSTSTPFNVTVNYN
jgi:hypothetical protein